MFVNHLLFPQKGSADDFRPSSRLSPSKPHTAFLSALGPIRKQEIFLTE